jgi:hypothetical protein
MTTDISPRVSNKHESTIDAEDPNISLPSIETTSEIKDFSLEFPKHWRSSTSDSSPLSLFGFRRFMTNQLLNVRFLEYEIAILESQIYQAGLKVEVPLETREKLGLSNITIDPNAPGFDKVVTSEMVYKLRRLLKEYSKRYSNLLNLFLSSCLNTNSNIRL